MSNLLLQYYYDDLSDDPLHDSIVKVLYKRYTAPTTHATMLHVTTFHTTTTLLRYSKVYSIHFSMQKNDAHCVIVSLAHNVSFWAQKLTHSLSFWAEKLTHDVNFWARKILK